MHKRQLQILVPLLIVVLVAGLWMIKNSRPEAGVTFTEVDRASLPVHLQDADFSLVHDGAVDIDALSAYGLPMVLDYGFESCGPCQRMKPTLEAMNEAMYGKAFIKYIDVVDHSNAADGLPVLVYPTQIFINADGTPFEPSAELQKTVHFASYTDKNTGELLYTTHQGVLPENQFAMILKEMGVE